MDKRLSQLSDEDLMDLILQQKPHAFTELVTRHTSRFYALAYRTVFDKIAAEDVVQEAFLRLWRNPGQWNVKQQVKFTTWFYRIIVNLSIDYNKKKQTFPLDDSFDIHDETSSLECRLDQQQKQQLVDRAIARLSQAQRTALNLCFYEKRSNQEAADIMGLTLKALQSLLIRAKKTLREKIQDTAKDVM